MDDGAEGALFAVDDKVDGGLLRFGDGGTVAPEQVLVLLAQFFVGLAVLAEGERGEQ